jgi:hypothetical protein
MTIYYLYIKTHNITGLKYLGYTKRKDPYTYQGSGKHWINHINKHGYDVTTEILKECSTKDEIKEWGLYYSKLWNIVEEKDGDGNKTWANLKEECGDGGDVSHCKSYQEKRHLFSHKGENNPAYGKNWSWTEGQKKSVSGENHPGYGKKWTEESRKRREEQGFYWTGKKRPFKNRIYNTHGDKNPNAKSVATPNGIFSTIKEASASHGIGPDALRARIKKYPTEYYYLNEHH